MTTLLNQALMLTLIGMGMTFAAIGLLVLGMYVLTAVVRETPAKGRRAVVIEVEKNPQSEAAAREVTAAVFPGVTVTPRPETEAVFRHRDGSDGEDRYRAAAAAVAIALATQMPRTERSTVTPQTTAVAVDGWNAFVKGQRLAQRQWLHALHARRSQ